MPPTPTKRASNAKSQGETAPPIGLSAQTAVDVLPPSLPSEAAKLARAVASGVPVKQALSELSVPAPVALAWMQHSDWPALLTRHETAGAALKTQMADLLPHAISVKRNVLTNPHVDLKLKNDASSEVLKFFRDSAAAEKVTRSFEVPHVEANLLVFILEELAGKVTGKVIDVTSKPTKIPKKLKTPMPGKGKLHVQSKTG